MRRLPAPVRASLLLLRTNRLVNSRMSHRMEGRHASPSMRHLMRSMRTRHPVGLKIVLTKSTRTRIILTDADTFRSKPAALQLPSARSKSQAGEEEGVS